MTKTLRRRILAFMRDSEVDEFGAIALALFTEQYERFPSYREMCARQGMDPKNVSDWQDIPRGTAPDPGAIEPDSEFDTAIVALALPELLQADTALLVVAPGAKDSGVGPSGISALLEFAAGHAPDGSFVSRSASIDTRTLRSWLGARQRDRRAVQLIGSAEGVRGLLEFLVRRNLKFRLPPGSMAYRLIATDVNSDAVPSDLLAERLGLAPDACPRLGCPASGTPLLERPAGTARFPLPHWVRSVGGGSGSAGPAGLIDLASTAAPAHRDALELGKPATG